jgi:CubicO group peptidase (beta-lactamase class C family)
VDEGQMKWDDPVRKHLPSFRLSDALADRDVTIRDLLCHRTSITRHDVIWFTHPDVSRDELLRRVALLPQDKPFRSEFQYNNYMYLAAGQAVGAASGSTWEEFTRRRIFEPLGMKTAVCDVKDALRNPNHVYPHRRKPDGTIERRKWLNIENMAPAGAIQASAKDLSQWLRFQLAGGVIDGKRLLKEEHVKETHTAQMVVRRDPQRSAIMPFDTTDHTSYALGWNVYDYRGHLIVSHGGGLPGLRSHTTLVPKHKLGLVVLCNGSVANSLGLLPEAVTKNLLDLYLGTEKRDWNEHHRKEEERLLDEQKKKLADRDKDRLKDTKPSLPASDYAGDYDDAAYGRIRVTVEGAALKMEWGSLKMRLEHFHLDTFTTAGEELPFRGMALDDRVVFRLGADGKVSGMTFVTREFRRQPKK